MPASGGENHVFLTIEEALSRSAPAHNAGLTTLFSRHIFPASRMFLIRYCNFCYTSLAGKKVNFLKSSTPRLFTTMPACLRKKNFRDSRLRRVDDLCARDFFGNYYSNTSGIFIYAYATTSSAM